MKIQTFIKLLKECKRSQIQTGFSERIGDLRVIVNPERTEFKIYKKAINKICRSCGTDLTKQEKAPVIIKFNQSQDPLSIFEAYLLFMVMKLKIKEIIFILLI